MNLQEEIKVKNLVQEEHLVDLNLDEKLKKMVLETYNFLEDPLESLKLDLKLSKEQDFDLKKLLSVLYRNNPDVIGEAILSSETTSSFLEKFKD